jgi:hypothetical protein
VETLQNAEWSLSRTALESLTLEQRTALLWNRIRWELIPILESLLPYFEKIIDFVPKIVTGWKALWVFFKWLLTNIAITVSTWVNNIIESFNRWGLRIQKVFSKLWSVFKTFWANLSIFVSNVKSTFEAGFPNAIASWANLAIWVLEKFINRAWKVLSKFSVIPWFEGLWNLWNVSLWRIETVWGTREFQSFRDNLESINDDFNSKIEASNQRQASKNKELETARLLLAQDTKNKLLKLDAEYTKATSETQRKRIEWERNALQEILWINEGWASSGWWKWGARVKSEKEAQDEIERIRKEEEEMEKRRNKSKQDRIKLLQERQKVFVTEFEKGMKEAEKSADSFKKSIERVWNEIGKLEDELRKLEEGRATTLWERNVQIQERRVELQRELNQLQASGVRDAWIDLDTLKNIWEGFIW